MTNASTSNRIDEQTMQLNKLNTDMKQNVVRLLGREVYELEGRKGRSYNRLRLYVDPFSSWVLIWNILFVFVFYCIELQISL